MIMMTTTTTRTMKMSSRKEEETQDEILERSLKQVNVAGETSEAKCHASFGELLLVSL